jgi:hypothetical protein
LKEVPETKLERHFVKKILASFGDIIFYDNMKTHPPAMVQPKPHTHYRPKNHKKHVFHDNALHIIAGGSTALTSSFTMNVLTIASCLAPYTPHYAPSLDAMGFAFAASMMGGLYKGWQQRQNNITPFTGLSQGFKRPLKSCTLLGGLIKFPYRHYKIDFNPLPIIALTIGMTCGTYALDAARQNQLKTQRKIERRLQKEKERIQQQNYLSVSKPSSVYPVPQLH